VRLATPLRFAHPGSERSGDERKLKRLPDNSPTTKSGVMGTSTTDTAPWP